ncbi:MAG: Bax protein [Pseudohongiellaceae bacterium]|jgi:Bax protein
MKNALERLTAKLNPLGLRAKAWQLQAGRVPVYSGAFVVGSLVAIIFVVVGRESAPDFREFEAGDERKQAFFSYFLPLIDGRNEELMALRENLLELNVKRSDNTGQLSFFERRQVAELANIYEIEGFSLEEPADWDTLLRRVDVVPPSLALAQAANESAWGTSRFAREGNNFYGQWCYIKGCGVVPAARNDGAVHEVAGFESAKESVKGYMRNLNYHPAYAELRLIRERLRDSDEPITGLKIAEGLESYSERGEAYIEELGSMIRFNDLDEYDASINNRQ